MSDFNPWSLKQFLDLTIKTNNSTYYISKEGIVSGDSNYFKKHPEMMNSVLKYAGSINPDEDLRISRVAKSDNDLEELTIQALEPLRIGISFIMGLKSEKLEEIVQMMTSSVKNYSKGGVELRPDNKPANYFIINQKDMEKKVNEQFEGEDKSRIISLINMYEGVDSDALNVLLHAQDKDKINEYEIKLAEYYCKQVQYVHPRLRKDFIDIINFFYSLYKELGVEKNF